MSKRRSIRRSSKYKSVNSIGSPDLNPDTDILGDEQTHWWNNLDENVSVPHSSAYNERNETAKQLSLNSQLDTTHNLEWWENLDFSDNENNLSSSPKRNYSAVAPKINILETSTSESEKILNIKKKKVPLRKTSRKSESNAFLNALSVTKADNLSETNKRQTRKQARDSVLNSTDSNKKSLQRESYRNKEDSLDFSPTVQIMKIRPSIFKRKQGREIKDRNAFEDVLVEERIVKESSKRIIDKSESYNNDQSKIAKLLQPPLTDSGKPDSSKLSITKSKSLILETNAASDINKNVQNSDNDSDISHKILKPKPRFSYRTRKSLGINAFEDALADNENISLPSRRNLSQETEIQDAKSLSSKNSSANLSKESTSRSKSKIDIVHKSLNTSRTSVNKRANLTVDANAVRTSVERHESEKEMADDSKDVTSTAHQQNSPSPKNSLNDKTASSHRTLSIRSILPISNRFEIRENRETSYRQQSPSSSLKNRNTSMKALSKDMSNDISKIDSFKTPRTIQDFFKTRRSSAVIDKPSVSSDKHLPRSQVFTDTKKIEKIKQKLERMKNREMAAMKMDADKNIKSKSTSNTKTVGLTGAAPQRNTREKLSTKPVKEINKAYLVNGEVYRAPRLPRPKHWVTNHLYKFLWKRMEPKYKLATRVQSEKFVQELAKIVSLIERRKNYDSYKAELTALMKEMARLQIISTRNDFYNFCYDFLPYEFRVKVVPILLPGNKRSIPYNPEKLHTPLLKE